MLNKIKKQVLPMLDTLGAALAQYLADETVNEALLADIVKFIDVINETAKDESAGLPEISKALKLSLENPELPEVERHYNQYCTAIESLPVQYKAVFMPYYDNTWDSLASVYEAFAADPMFAVEIVILPIRRNTPYGWKLVYKDYLTPKGIPNTPYQSYDIERDLPDLVFYNNPYDGTNIEKFQSHRIKPYAGCMVYIPYFLYRHRFLLHEIFAASVASMTELPGHNSCDIFVAQGESFLKRYSGRSQNGGKMVALGNPKTDHIAHSVRAPKRNPAWEEVIGGRHVFLLNTHYTGVTKNTLKPWAPNLFNYMDSRGDMVLIWRPHPQSFLMLDDQEAAEGTIVFHWLLEKAQKSERIILDRTESAFSAMMYSNAVVSQPSSIVAETIFLNKPVLLTAMERREKLPDEKYDQYATPEYYEKVQKLRKYDRKKLFLGDAVVRRGLNRPLHPDEDFNEYFNGACIFEFMEDIANGRDEKKELRGLFREQLFVNREGNCGKAILEHIKTVCQQGD